MPTQTVHLRIMATSDLHMHMNGHDYFEDAPRPEIGLAALTGQIESLRQTAPGACLLLDNGDLLQGTLLADYLAATDHAPHPVAEVMNRLGYDAVGLGNHDLDYGLDYLAGFARDLTAPVLCANLQLTPQPDWVAPNALLDAGGLRVGIVSVLPKRTEIWAHDRLTDSAGIADMTETVRSGAAALRAKGADVVIALAHTGIGQHADENALTHIARDGQVDALIGGHTHMRFPHGDARGVDGAQLNTGHLFAVPTVMPGYAGEALGCIDLTVELGEATPAQIVHSNACLVGAVPVAGGSELPELRQVHAAARAELNTAVGHSDIPLHSFFAQVQPTAMLALAATAQMQAIETVRNNTEFADLPLLSATAPERAGGLAGPDNFANIPAGPLTRRQIAQLHVFQNDICAVPVTGAELRAWLEKSAAAFNAPDDLAQHGLLSPDVPAFDFDVIYGLTYHIDPTAAPRYDRDGNLLAPNAARIGGLAYHGRAIQDSDRFLIATTSYRANGGGGVPGLSPARPSFRPGLPAAQVMQDFVRSGAAQRLPAPWSLHAPSGDLHTWFDTGPGALAHLDEISHLTPGPPTRLPTGFVRLPVTI